jgi:hypothetical protein
MKILFLNHNFDAQHKIGARLQSSGATLLFAGHAEEAWKMIQLHGASLDLAVIHRESKGGVQDEGERLLGRIKADSTQSDLPIIFTSSLWNESEFFQHQQGPLGANAYLHWPFDEDQLIKTIETMFGSSIQLASHTNPAIQVPAGQPAGAAKPGEPPLPELTGMSVMLEPAAVSEPATADLMPADEASIALPVLEERPGALAESTGEEPPLPTDHLKLNAASEIKLEAPIPSEVKGLSDNSGITLEGATTAFEEPVPTLEPAAITLEAPSLIAIEAPQSSATPQDGAPSAFTLVPPSEVSDAMNADLEAHEKLEIDMQLKDSEAEVPELKVEEDGAKAAQVEAQVEDDDDLVSDLPYLFAKKNPGDKAKSALVFAEPVGDAVIPGGACLSPDTETLKKYLLLREQDVAILSNQLKAAREHAMELEKKLREEIGKTGELEHLAVEQQRRIDEFEKEKALALEGLQSEIDELKFQNKAKADKARTLEAKVNEATDEIERLKERVRTDIRKIRVREKELENKLEIVRKDSEALIAARENKIMELKRKIDLLEFNIDLLQDQNAREKENSAQLRERLAKAAQVVRVAGGLLDSQGKQAAFGVSDHVDSRTEKKGAQEAS